MLPASTPLTDLEWVPTKRLPALTRLKLVTLGDLIRHYPRRHENRRRFDHFPDGEMDQAVCLHGVVVKSISKRLGSWKRLVEVVIEEEAAGVLSPSVTCRWFNMPFIHKMIVQGDTLVVFGRPKKRGQQIVIDHPEFEIIDEDETSIHMNRIVPVHPAGDGVSTRLLRSLIHQAFAETDLSTLPRLLPAGQPGILRALHFPNSPEAWESARQELVHEEFFALQLLIQARRREWERLPGIVRQAKGTLLKMLLDELPFTLTKSQREVIKTIRRDLIAPTRMNRLLQGDVGSGKTLVALAAMLLTVESGSSAVLMAPTQILAEQHYLNFRRLLEPLGIPVSLRTAARKESGGPHAARVYGAAARRSDGFGEPPNPAPEPGALPETPGITVGTHALFYDETESDPPGLIVIDEQHKFGVLQRARLIERGNAPDVLIMTATPIPRTLTQTLYGDLEISLLLEKPANRGEIQTVARESKKLPEVVAFLRKQIEKGRQAYIVYPLVEDSEKLAVKSATAEFEKWKPLLAPHAIGLIHGRLDAAEKEAIMANFRDGHLAALIATTVIEVGVDVPNANFMIVENAERFGLAQLHQLRGRVGRGAHKSYCVLLHDPKLEDAAQKKLSVLEQTDDGFQIAEADLRLRGPGDLLGTAQTGLPPLKLGDLFADGDLMQAAVTEVAEIFRADPDLTLPEHSTLRDFVRESQAQIVAAAG